MHPFFSRSFDLTTAHAPFYLEMLEEQQIDLSTLTVDDFFYVDEELAQRCEEVAEIGLIAEYEPAALSLLNDHPTSAHALLAIAGARCIDEVTLRAGLALRELADFFLEQQADKPFDEETLINLGGIGVDILCEQMLLMDLSSLLLEKLTVLMQRVPICTDYVLFTALRNGAVFEINRDEGQTENFFTTIRDMLAASEHDDPSQPQLVELADIVYTYLQDEEITDALQGRIETFNATPLTEVITEEIDFYLDAEPMLEPLFEAFHTPPTTPVHNIPYEDLDDDDRAEVDVETAMQLPAPMRRARMHELIEQHPNSLWPWVGLVETADSALDELDLAEKGLAHAKKINAPSNSPQVIALMSARAHSLMFESRYPEAIDAFEEMLAIDEAALSKVGEPLLAMLIRRGQRQHFERAEQIITALQEIEPSQRPALPWLTLLYHIVRKHETSVTNAALAVALQERPFIADIIIGREPEPFAEDDAALHTIILCRLCWPVYPEAVKMLKKMMTI